MLTVNPGLAGVVAFDTEIAEPDRAGGTLRYRGIDVEKLAGSVSFGDVWGLLVDGDFDHGLPPAEPFALPVHSGDVRVDVQAAIAMMTPYWGLRRLIDIDEAQAREDLARTSVMMLSFVAQAARGSHMPAVPQRLVEASGEHHRAVHDPLAVASRTRGMCRRSTGTGSGPPSTA